MSLVLAEALETSSLDINELALNTTLYYAADLSYTVLDVGLSSAFFGTWPDGLIKCNKLRLSSFTGILTLLVLVAIVFLMYAVG